MGRPNLCRSGLTRDVEKSGVDLSPNAVSHHGAQTSLHVLDSLRLRHLFANDNGRFFLDDLSVAQDCFDEAWAHHLTIVGNAVVKSQRTNRWYLRYVANTHPRQVRLCPAVA